MNHKLAQYGLSIFAISLACLSLVKEPKENIYTQSEMDLLIENAIEKHDQEIVRAVEPSLRELLADFEEGSPILGYWPPKTSQDIQKILVGDLQILHGSL